MSNPLTEQREKEIRGHIGVKKAGGLMTTEQHYLVDLLNEIDRLRAENKRLGYAISGIEHALERNRTERTSLRRLYSELKGAGISRRPPHGPAAGHAEGAALK